MKETLSRKYLAILALLAVSILLIGVRFRPPKANAEEQSPTETALLQERVRRDQAAGIGQYLASRAAELAGQVVFLPDSRTSAVRYETPTKLLTLGGPQEIVEPFLTVATASRQSAPAPLATGQRNPDSWVLMVGRSAEDKPLWTASIHGASHPRNCNGVPYEEVVLNVALDRAFVGAGAYDLDGSLVGMAIPCGGALHVISIASVPAFLAASQGLDREFVKKFGFRAAPLSDSWARLYPRLRGLLITDVWKDTWADRNDLLPGDLIVSDEPDLSKVDMGMELKIARIGRPGVVRTKVDSAPGTNGITVLPVSPAFPELRIDPGSRADRAGLRTGDRLVAIVGQRNTSVVNFSKLLSAPNQDSLNVIYERGLKRSLVELRHE